MSEQWPRTFKETRPIAQAGGPRSQSLETGKELDINIVNKAWDIHKGL